MSDLKVDGIIASTGTNTNLTLEGKGTGGVKITDYLVQTKGADIGSATSLTLGKDGNQFDVTGTTTITSIGTQGIGSYVTLHFDGALTFTHHSTNLILPGAANITTAAGDIAVMYEYASADWRCVSYTKASGAAVAGGGKILQVVHTNFPTHATGSTTMPKDDTVPQITEGNEFMTQAITPTAADSTLHVIVSVNIGESAGAQAIVYGLFRDSTANAVTSGWMEDNTGNNYHSLVIHHEESAASTSSTTFKFRAGPETSAAARMNGNDASFDHGANFSSSMTIMEISA